MEHRWNVNGTKLGGEIDKEEYARVVMELDRKANSAAVRTEQLLT